MVGQNSRGGGRRQGGSTPPRDGADRSRYRNSPGQRPTSRRSAGEKVSRPGQEARAQRMVEPSVPGHISGRELDRDLRDELRGLSKESAERVAKHLVAALQLEEEDFDFAFQHARFAAQIGGRIGGVREIHGIFAYRAGDFKTASRELRTAQRITGRNDLLPMIADCERGMGRPERALDIAGSVDAAGLDVESTIELMIVVAGAYADTGDLQTALGTLEMPALRHKVDGRWQVRLWVAYADLLDRVGRREEAHRWLTLAADADAEGLTDAAERLGRPVPVLAPAVSWGDEEVAVLDSYDDTADDDTGDDSSGEDSAGDHGSAPHEDSAGGADGGAEAAVEADSQDAPVSEREDQGRDAPAMASSAASAVEPD